MLRVSLTLVTTFGPKFGTRMGAQEVPAGGRGMLMGLLPGWETTPVPQGNAPKLLLLLLFSPNKRGFVAARPLGTGHLEPLDPRGEEKPGLEV